ncbi:MAG TPA: isoprenylcysteine carboxylmethyltransferase family protein [Pyrinomonadaceae bacterium]|jgi:protein-S-isoprenylcysteine O-methyltransferase Ste14|nr:isoprenylcysteine carboxylmethyltransferase family protein [Pyrinomonadaceae bacterium]
MILLKTIIFTFLVPGTVTILVPYWLLSSRSAPLPMQFGIFRYCGAPLLLLGAAIYSWCAWDFTFTGRGTPAPIDPPKELVVRGLYRYVRNPMYIGILSILSGEALLFESRRLFAYTAGVFILYYVIVLLYEEPILRRKFGESYERYCKAVPRWLPCRIRG